MIDNKCPECNAVMDVVQIEYSNKNEHGYYWTFECPSCDFNWMRDKLEPFLMIRGASVLTPEQKKILDEATK